MRKIVSLCLGLIFSALSFASSNDLNFGPIRESFVPLVPKVSLRYPEIVQKELEYQAKVLSVFPVSHADQKSLYYLVEVDIPHFKWTKIVFSFPQSLALQPGDRIQLKFTHRFTMFATDGDTGRFDFHIPSKGIEGIDEYYFNVFDGITKVNEVKVSAFTDNAIITGQALGFYLVGGRITDIQVVYVGKKRLQRYEPPVDVYNRTITFEDGATRFDQEISLEKVNEVHVGNIVVFVKPRRTIQRDQQDPVTYHWNTVFKSQSLPQRTFVRENYTLYVPNVPYLSSDMKIDIGIYDFFGTLTTHLN